VQVSYTTTVDDYVAFALHAYWKSSSMRTRFWAAWVVIPICCFVVATYLELSYSQTIAAVCVGGFGVVYSVFYPPIFWHRVSDATRKYAEEMGPTGTIGRITLILTDETLTEVTEAARSEARWRDMKGMEVVGDCTYIYITGLLAAIIPRHGFEPDEDYFAVRDFALAKLAPPG
jgi:YcxB-like protein